MERREAVAKNHRRCFDPHTLSLPAMRSLRLWALLALFLATAAAFGPAVSSSRRTNGALSANTSNKPNLEETTEKYGLEAGLFESLKQQDGDSAKSLLKKYGIAYLATSIPLALVSFALCYYLVDHGVDMSALLSKVGIESSPTSETAGTVAIAYAAHKAASPIRFPPTVLLTPVVAKWIGKEPELNESS